MPENSPHRTAGPWRVHPRQDRGVGVIIGTYVDDDALVAEAMTSMRLLDHGDRRRRGERPVHRARLQRLQPPGGRHRECRRERRGCLARDAEGGDYAQPARETLDAAAAELRAALEEPLPPGVRPR